MLQPATYGNLKGGNDKIHYDLNLFYQLENYYDINEKLIGENYSRYDVNSFREDMGVLFSITREVTENNTFTGGLELKHGSVEGGDYYQTILYNTVLNAGKIKTLAGYIQDEHAFMDNKIRLIAGLRFDRVSFTDGEYYTTDPHGIQRHLYIKCDKVKLFFSLPSKYASSASTVFLTPGILGVFSLSISLIHVDIPGYAAIHKSILCSKCGESVMDSRIIKKDNKTLCIDCSANNCNTLTGQGITIYYNN